MVVWWYVIGVKDIVNNPSSYITFERPKDQSNQMRGFSGASQLDGRTSEPK